jgi:hypothetical protein
LDHVRSMKIMVSELREQRENQVKVNLDTEMNCSRVEDFNPQELIQFGVLEKLESENLFITCERSCSTGGQHEFRLLEITRDTYRWKILV